MTPFGKPVVPEDIKIVAMLSVGSTGVAWKLSSILSGSAPAILEFRDFVALGLDFTCYDVVKHGHFFVVKFLLTEEDDVLEVWMFRQDTCHFLDGLGRAENHPWFR